MLGPLKDLLVIKSSFNNLQVKTNCKTLHSKPKPNFNSFSSLFKIVKKTKEPIVGIWDTENPLTIITWLTDWPSQYAHLKEGSINIKADPTYSPQYSPVLACSRQIWKKKNYKGRLCSFIRQKVFFQTWKYFF